jgi:hypothetical protein
MKINLRLPNDLAQQLRDRAEAEGVSMNTLILTLLAGSIAYTPTTPDEPEAQEPEPAQPARRQKRSKP